MHYSKKSTYFILSSGLVLALLTILPFYAWIFGENWPLVQGFPLGWLSAGMSYMATFFHEIGHTVFMWFYGYPTIPIFDFEHGGGFAVAVTGQQILILVVIWGLMAYGLWFLRGYLGLQLLVLGAFILNVSLTFSLNHNYVCDFMGPAFECLMASFLLYRALFDLAPRGDLERFLNSFFGFGMIFQVFVNGYGLLNSGAFRLVYYEQKGSHGFGDFDKIADYYVFLDFQIVVYIWLALNSICLVAPFILFISRGRRFDI